MKKVMIMITAAMLLLSAGSFAANLKDDVNERALSAFAKDFTGATQVNWQERDNLYLVEFKLDGASFNAAYNSEGELLSSSKSIRLEELPLAVTVAVNKKYLGYEIGNNAAELTFDGQTNYFLTIANSQQVLFIRVDARGHIKVERKTTF
ncbi:MAG TPA: hypothetical protein PLY34_14465 [Ferruginibacter sp.]|nr:hypothetical protein [Ferruginibacter sp.]HPH92221.1 hypothetical protein [Ferruginibacter sp.]